MSAQQNGRPIHAWSSYAGAGLVVTACGALVEDRYATTDCVRVTCRSKGCVATSDVGLNQRHEVKRIKW